MDVSVARADDHAVVAVEQQISVEAVGPGLHNEEEAEQRRAVSNGCRRHRPVMHVGLDVAVHPVDDSGEKRAQNQAEQHPVLDDDIGRQYEEIETDVLVVERVVRTIGHAVEKLQEDIPIADFYRGDQ